MALLIKSVLLIMSTSCSKEEGGEIMDIANITFVFGILCMGAGASFGIFFYKLYLKKKLGA